MSKQKKGSDAEGDSPKDKKGKHGSTLASIGLLLGLAASGPMLVGMVNGKVDFVEGLTWFLFIEIIALFGLSTVGWLADLFGSPATVIDPETQAGRLAVLAAEDAARAAARAADDDDGTAGHLDHTDDSDPDELLHLAPTGGNGKGHQSAGERNAAREEVSV